MATKTELVTGVIASISTVLASILAYYQFFAVASTDDVVDSLTDVNRSILRIEKSLKDGLLLKLSDTAAREVLLKLDDTTQLAMQDASTRGIENLPVMYIRDKGISVATNDHASFQTSSGKISIFAVNNVYNNYANVKVDGLDSKVQSGDIVKSNQDPNCSYFVGELSNRTKPRFVSVRIVCEDNRTR